MIVAGFAASTRFLVGCGSGSGPAVNLPTGSIEGYAFDQGGVLALRNSPTVPAGTTVLAGATVSVDGFNRSVSTDASGHFVINGPIGQRMLHVLPAGGGTRRDHPVTVLR